MKHTHFGRVGMWCCYELWLVTPTCRDEKKEEEKKKVRVKKIGPN